MEGSSRKPFRLLISSQGGEKLQKIKVGGGLRQGRVGSWAPVLIRINVLFSEGVQKKNKNRTARWKLPRLHSKSFHGGVTSSTSSSPSDKNIFPHVVPITQLLDALIDIHGGKSV